MYKTIFHSVTGLLAALLFVGAASASDLKYSYVDLRYFDGDFDDADADGLILGGSYKVNNEIFVIASYGDFSFDDFDADLSDLRVGAGYIHPFSEAVDLTASLSVVRLDLDLPGGDDNETGFAITGGARTMLKAIENLEVRGELTYIDVDDSDVRLKLAGDYHINEQFSAGLEINLIGDIEGIAIGGRYYFQ